jgi:hypothetical protein
MFQLLLSLHILLPPCRPYACRPRYLVKFHKAVWARFMAGIDSPAVQKSVLRRCCMHNAKTYLEDIPLLLWHWLLPKLLLQRVACTLASCSSLSVMLAHRTPLTLKVWRDYKP